MGEHYSIRSIYTRRFSEEGGKVLIDYHFASPRVSLDFLNLSLRLIKWLNFY
jgi:hypothetical protein